MAQTVDQVAGEAREKLADRIEDVVKLREGFSGMTDIHLDNEDWAIVIAALRAQPERGAEEMRERAAGEVWRVYKTFEYTDWTPVGIAAAIRALPLHLAKDDGGGR